MKYRRTKSFSRDFASLPNYIQLQVKEKFELFKTDLFHPSLRVKKMQGETDIWEGHITMDYVFTFHWDETEEGAPIIVFRRIGSHSIYKAP